MKKLFVICMMLVATITFATAQQGQGQGQRQGQGQGMGQRQTAEERAKSQTERVVKLLTLTADQKTKIQAIELELAKKMDTLRQNSQGDREGMRTAMEEINKTRDTKYKAVLTADQFKKYTADNEQRQKEMAERRSQRPN